MKLTRLIFHSLTFLAHGLAHYLIIAHVYISNALASIRRKKQ